MGDKERSGNPDGKDALKAKVEELQRESREMLEKGREVYKRLTEKPAASP